MDPNPQQLATYLRRVRYQYPFGIPASEFSVAPASELRCGSMPELRGWFMRECIAGAALDKQEICWGVGAERSKFMIVLSRYCAAGVYAGSGGELLRALIEKGLKLDPDSVYVSSYLKLKDTAALLLQECLRQEVALVNPAVILCMGDLALSALVPGAKGSLAVSRGKWLKLAGRDLLPTIDPEAVVSEPAKKRLLWQDLQELLKMELS